MQRSTYEEEKRGECRREWGKTKEKEKTRKGESLEKKKFRVRSETP